MPRRAWVAIAIGLALAVFLIVRQALEKHDQPVVASDRPRLLREAQAALRADPNVTDLVYSAPTDQWDVTPAVPDVDPRAFGRYVCFVLGQAGVAAPQTSVRVIDGARLEARDFDYAAASRGVLTCEEGKE